MELLPFWVQCHNVDILPSIDNIRIVEAENVFDAEELAASLYGGDESDWIAHLGPVAGYEARVAADGELFFRNGNSVRD